MKQQKEHFSKREKKANIEGVAYKKTKMGVIRNDGQ